MYDVIIIGGGPAGMTAALYARRNGKTALVIEKNGFGGQITFSPKVENFPGTVQMSGNEFAEHMLDQILKQGAEIEFETVNKIEDGESNGYLPVKKVYTEEGSTFETYTVIIANGVKHRMLGIQGENDFVGDGISFCAVCDGDFYSGKTVCVAGGGNSALQEAILLSEKCKEVIILQDLPYFTGEKRLQDILFSKANVKYYTSQKIIGINSDNGVFKGLQVKSSDSDIVNNLEVDGLFVAIGLIPENQIYADFADLNDYGYFDSDEGCKTKTPGIFVAGDCRSKGVRQLTTAIADGSTAALAACRYIDEN